MVSEKFTRQLRQEAQKWRSENLIDESIYEQLSQRYQFESLETSAKNRFVMILIGVGSILLGLAVITFVAANWDGLSRSFKVVLLSGFFLLINCTGFYLWNSTTQGWQRRFGSGLLLFGNLLLGANIGLMSQLFHQSGPIYQLYLIWSIAIVMMAYGLNMTMLAILSLILFYSGYLAAISEFVSFDLNSSIFTFIIDYFPLLLSLIFIPLAYRCKSRWLFGLTIFFLINSYGTSLLRRGADLISSSAFLSSFLTINFVCFLPAFLWAYQDSLWTKNKVKFQVISRSFSVLLIAVVFYFASFKFIWQEAFIPQSSPLNNSDLFIFIEPIILIALTILAWWDLGLTNQSDEQKSGWKIDLSSTVIALMLLLTAVLITYHQAIAPITVWGVLFFNLLLGILAIGLIRESLTEAKRGRFWTGIILIVLQIFTRTIEYDTDLLFKALVFFLCGIGIIFAGLWFEKNVKLTSYLK